MGRVSWLVVGLTFLFDIIAFGLAVGAETRRSKGTAVPNVTGQALICQYTRDIATGLAAGAFLFLLGGQVFIMVVTRCLCCGASYKPGAARVFAIILFIFSWLSFIIAEACLLAGASQNKIHTHGLFDNGGADVTCKQVRKSIFAAGAGFTFLTMLLSEIYYLLLSKAGNNDGGWQSYKAGAPTVGMTAYT